MPFELKQNTLIIRNKQTNTNHHKKQKYNPTAKEKELTRMSKAA